MEVTLVRDALVAAFQKVFFQARTVLRKGGRTGIVRDVQGRVGEDKETRLDRFAELLVADTLEEFGLQVLLISEHAEYGSREAEGTILLDPFDGSTPAEQGMTLESIFYSSAAYFDESERPRVGVVLDVKESCIHLAVDGEMSTLYLRERDGEIWRGRQIVEVPRPTTIVETTVATYMLGPRYLMLSVERARVLFEHCRKNGLLLHFNGGSFMAGTMAAGKQGIGLYFLADELLSETAIFKPFIEAAEMTAVVIDEMGEVEPFRVDIAGIRSNPSENYREAPRMHLFIIGLTEEIVSEAVRLVLESWHKSAKGPNSFIVSSSKKRPS